MKRECIYFKFITSFVHALVIVFCVSFFFLACMWILFYITFVKPLHTLKVDSAYWANGVGGVASCGFLSEGSPMKSSHNFIREIMEDKGVDNGCF